MFRIKNALLHNSANSSCFRHSFFNHQQCSNESYITKMFLKSIIHICKSFENKRRIIPKYTCSNNKSGNFSGKVGVREYLRINFWEGLFYLCKYYNVLGKNQVIYYDVYIILASKTKQNINTN